MYSKERTCGAFAFDVELKDLLHARWHIEIAINIAAAKFDLHHFFFFIVINAVNGGRLGCEYRI